MPVSPDSVPSPDSAGYLFLVQQSKRIALSTEIARFSRQNVLLWPFLLMIVLVRYIDLVISNALIRSLINEMDLQRLAAGDQKRDPGLDKASLPVSLESKT